MANDLAVTLPALTVSLTRASSLAVDLPALVSALHESAPSLPNDGIGYIDVALTPLSTDMREFPVPEDAVYRVSREPRVTHFAESAEVLAAPGHYVWVKSGLAFAEIAILKSLLESGSRRMVSGIVIGESDVHFIYHPDGDTPVQWEDRIYIEPREAVPAVGAYSIVTGKTGWDSGGQGKQQVHVGQRFIFTMKRAVAVQAGIARDTAGQYSFAAPLYGWYRHGFALECMRRGRSVAVFGTFLSDDDIANWMFAIERRGGVIRWLYAPSKYHPFYIVHTEPDDGGAMYPVGMPYAVGDSVDAHGIVTHNVLMAELPVVGRMSENEYAGLRTSLPRLKVSLTADFTARLVPNFPAVQARITERASGRLQVDLPALTTDMRAEPTFKVHSVYGLLPLSVKMRGVAGSLGRLNTTVPPLFTRLESTPHGRIDTTLSALSVRMSDFHRSSGMDFLAIGFEHHLESPLLLISVDGLNLSDSVTVSVIIRLESAERLELTDASSIGDMIQLLVKEGLHLADGGNFSRREALQYAVNLLTGAPSVYAGFDFLGFVNVDGIAYGWKADGLYRLGADRDGEETIRALVDFGTSDYRTSQRKRVPTAWLGIRTDGQTYLKVRADDGAEHVYRAKPSSETHKAILAKGVAGRQWSLILEIEDASFASLDSIELEVAVTQRRFGGN